MRARLNTRQMAMLLEELEMYVSAGLSPGRAIGAIAKAAGKRQRQVLEKLRTRLDSGQNVAAVFEQELGLPPPIIGLLSCGESSGSLAAALRAAHSVMEQRDELAKRCLSAMTYPIVIGIATVALALGLMDGVMPQMIPLLSGLHRDLPVLTRVVMAVSGFISTWGLLTAAAIVISAIAATAGYRRMPSVRRAAHSCLGHIPVIGGLTNDCSCALFLRSLGTMIGSGMPADAAYGRAVGAVSFGPLRSALSSGADTIRSGGSIGELASARMPGFVAALVTAGEASGQLSEALIRSASIIERQIGHTLGRLTALMEPAMMICMGGMVGSIALSIMMPIYDVSRALQR